MCTVTYLPQSSGFVLTHNRDEAPSRSPQTLVSTKRSNGDVLLFPRDTQAGGTWIATARYGRSACLLNGAFTLHTRKLPYRRSRGLILLDFFDWENPDDFFEHYDLDNIEPFTFLFFQRQLSESLKQLSESFTQLSESFKLSESSASRVTEFRWDGQQRHLKHLSAQEPHFWCSATLYPAEMQTRREQVFKDWLAAHPIGPTVRPSSILQLHLKGSVGDPENDYVMNRWGKVQTVSVTQIILDEKNARMRYRDLLSGNRSERRQKQSERRPLIVNR